MRCPECGFDAPDGMRFCGACGASLAVACAACGAEAPPGFRFCGACGRELDVHPPDTGTAGPTERRRVTVLFADLVGFSTLAEHLDPEVLHTLISETFAELTEEVTRRSGNVEKFIGDAIVAIFGAPIAHEDDPRRAVEAGLAMLEAVERRSGHTPAPLELRIGINSGLVVAGPAAHGGGTGVLGDAVNAAARLQQIAGPGQLLVAEPVWRRVRDHYEAQHLGALEVKGRDQTIDAYRVTGRREPSPRRKAPFVGRQEELALLELLWSSARKGNTHAVSLVGDPGVGKSRLLGELPTRDDATDIRITCGSERTFGPFLLLIERILGRKPSDADDLQRQTAAVGLDESTAALIAALLGLSGAPPAPRMSDEQRSRQVFAGVWQLLIAATSERPALVVLDDVHWADRSSLDLLEFLLEALHGVPLMLVMAYRPGFPQVERAALRASHTGIRVELLDHSQSISLARGYLGVDELPRDLEELVATKAEGNPFFIEELLQALLELGCVKVEDGVAHLETRELHIPDTVQGTIVARVDRLDPPERALLQTAAILGRSFKTPLLEAVASMANATPSLERLAKAQLVVQERPGCWAFKHSLIQEVTYDSLLLRTRKELHARAARALEGLAGRDPELLQEIARHYARAEDQDNARRYAVAAGDVAAKHVGFVDAYRMYETALELWGEGDPAGRLDLLMKIGSVAQDPAIARIALIEAEAGWRERGDLRRAGAALARLGRVHWLEGDGDRSAEVLERAVALLEPLGPSEELVWALVWSSTFNMLTGRYAESISVAERGLGIARELALDAARSHLENNVGTSKLLTGDLSGEAQIRSALELAQASGDVEALGRAHVNLTNGLWQLGRYEEALSSARTGRRVLAAAGAPGFEWFLASLEAIFLVELGDYDQAETICREIWESERHVHGAPLLVSAATTLALAATRKGRYQEARRYVDDALPLSRRMAGSDFLAETLAIEVQLEQARGNLASARRALEEMLEMAIVNEAGTHWASALVPAAQLIERGRVEELLAIRTGGDHVPLFAAVRQEAEAWLDRDTTKFAAAAQGYDALGLHYQRARCLIEAGEFDVARDLLERYGLERGPLGDRLRQVAPSIELDALTRAPTAG